MDTANDIGLGDDVLDNDNSRLSLPDDSAQKTKHSKSVSKLHDRESRMDTNDFWTHGNGSHIMSYGKWLFAYGIIIIILHLFSIFYLLIMSEEYGFLTSDYSFILSSYFIRIIFGIYFIIVGIKIMHRRLSPDAIRTSSTLIIILIFCSSLMNAVLDDTTVAKLGIIDAIVLAKSITYKLRWHKTYLDFIYGHTKNIKASNVKDDINEKEKYFDGFSICVFIVVPVIILLLIYLFI